jgi:hypothetical protein
MDDPPARGQPTNFRPPNAQGRRAWKNWESAKCIDWVHFLDKLQAKIEIHKGYTPLIIIEGFLLLEDTTAAAMCDHVIAIDIPKEVAWQRRLSRALQMAQGQKDASGMENYEQLHVYALPEDYREIEGDAAAAVERYGRQRVYPSRAEALEHAELAPASGTYDWLRLYFDEVIWTEACAVNETVRHLHRSGIVDVSSVNGADPPAAVERATRQLIKRVISPRAG